MGESYSLVYGWLTSSCIYLPRTLFYAKAIAGAKSLNPELGEPNGCHGWGLWMGEEMGSTGKGLWGRPVRATPAEVLVFSKWGNN